MFSQLTVYAKIIYLLMVVISGALCTVEDYVIMSQCAHNKAVHLAAEGTVSVTDISQTQNITIVGLPDFVNNDYKIALYAKETKRYLCFNENWKLVGMQELQDTCYFNETIVHGYFVFRSVVDLQRRIGFTHRGKAIGPKKNVSNDACYMFTKIQADQFFHQHRAKMMTAPTSSSATMTASTTATTSAATTTIKIHTNNNRRYHNKIQNQSHINGHNSNLSNKNRTNLRNTTKQQQQQHYTREHVQRQHLVRHHHNDPNAIARRHHHEQKQKRRQQQQQRARSRTTTTLTPTTTAASPKTTTKTRNLTYTAEITPTKTIKPTTRRTATATRRTIKNRHKIGRKRKIESTLKKTTHHKERLLHKLQQQNHTPTTTRSTSTTQTEADWSMSENWWSNFTEDFNNNNTYNNNTDYSSNEWMIVDPSPVSPLFFSTLMLDNELSDNYESISSSTGITDLEPATSTISYESSTTDTSLDILDLDNSENNTNNDNDTELWSSATPMLSFSPATKVTFKKAQEVAVIETTTSINDNINSTDQFDIFTDIEHTDNSSDHSSMSESSVATTLNLFVINRNQHRKLQRGRGNKFVRKLAQPTAANSALTTPFLQSFSAKLTTTTTTPTTPNPKDLKEINNIIQINKNISEMQIHNRLSDKVDPSTIKTKEKVVRKSTQNLLATPFHKLIQYVRNEDGEIDIDNIDNISIYPEVSSESDVDYSAPRTESIKIKPHRRLAILSGYLPTSASVVLPESIKIAKIKINKERKRMLRQRRRHGVEGGRILA